MSTSSTQRTISRRALTRGAAVTLGGLALARPFGALAAQDKVTVHWWDHFLPIAPLEKKLFAQYHDAHGNVTVDYKVYNPNEMGQALQLAYKSKQMPDVSTLAGIGLPVRKLYEEGWFQALANGADIEKALPAGSLLEGFTVFDGKIYSFPTLPPGRAADDDLLAGEEDLVGVLAGSVGVLPPGALGGGQVDPPIGQERTV